MLTAIAELIKEVVDLVPPKVIHVDVEPDESCLYERHDLFELSLILFDHILVQRIV